MIFCHSVYNIFLQSDQLIVAVPRAVSLARAARDFFALRPHKTRIFNAFRHQKQYNAAHNVPQSCAAVPATSLYRYTPHIEPNMLHTKTRQKATPDFQDV